MTVTSGSMGGEASASSPADIPETGDITLVMLVDIAGTRNGEDWPRRGGEVTLPNGEARDMIAGRLAVLADTQPAKKSSKAPAKKSAAKATEPAES